jgi:HPt (histidine-containing phosphotransfer) domain-containing protein
MTGPQDQPIDEAVLEALRTSVGGDDAFVADLVGTYLTDTRAQLDAIEAAVGASDAAALVRPAHTLKSASLTVGAMRLGEIARTLEQRARNEAVDGTPDLAADARQEFEAVDAALGEWLREHGAATR